MRRNYRRGDEVDILRTSGPTRELMHMPKMALVFWGAVMTEGALATGTEDRREPETPEASPPPPPEPDDSERISASLAARSGNLASVDIGGGNKGIDIPSDAAFTLILTASGAIRAPALFRKSDGQEAAVAGVEWSGTGSEMTAERTADDPGGEFLAKGEAQTDSGEWMEFTTPLLTVNRDAAKRKPGGSDDDKVAEIEAGGEYDQHFAERTLRRVLQIAWVPVGVFVLVSLVVLADDVLALIRTGAVSAWGETIGPIGQLLCITAGIVAVLLAAWMAMLETRGRQRAASKSSGTVRGGGVVEAFSAAGELAGQLRRVRGLIALLVAGLLLVVVGIVWSQGAELLPAPSEQGSSSSGE